MRMAKSVWRKVIIAGTYVCALQYRRSTDPDVKRLRSPKREVSSDIRAAINLRNSFQKFKVLLACNFAYTDLVVTLTYSDDRLPSRRADAEKLLKAFIRKLRAHRRAAGAELKYMYVTESGHLKGRYHHHIVINAVGNDYQTIRDLWTHGDNIDFSGVWRKGYDGWSRYLCKEPRDSGRHYVGERMWRNSTNLRRPEIVSGWVESAETLSAPSDAIIIDANNRSNIYGDFHYLEYELPQEKPNTARRKI